MSVLTLSRAILKRAIPRRWICYQQPLEQRRVGLSFDDGPWPGLTERVLDLLQEWHCAATFFVIGQRAAAAPDLIRRIHRQQCELGNHSYSHPDFAQLDAAAMRCQIEQTDEALASILGFAPRYFRPPCGKLSLGLLRMLHAMGRLPVMMWSQVVGGDEAIYCPSRQEVLDSLHQQTLQAGDILLLHDSNAATVEALPEILSHLKDHDLQPVPIGTLLAGSSDKQNVPPYANSIPIKEEVGRHDFPDQSGGEGARI